MGGKEYHTHADVYGMQIHTQTHTQTHTHIYIYIYMIVHSNVTIMHAYSCVCVDACLSYADVR